MAGKRYSYIRKGLAYGTWQAAAAAGISALLMLLALAISVINQGSGPLLVGALGISSLLSAVISLNYSLSGIREKKKNRLWAALAGAGSGVITLFWVVLIFVGIRLG